MASIRKRGNSYLIVVSMGYDYNGNRRKAQQKTVHPPAKLMPAPLWGHFYRKKMEIWNGIPPIN